MAEVASAFVSLMPSAKGFGRSTERQIGPQMTSVAKRTGSRFGKVFAYSSMSPLKAIGAAAIGLFAVKKVKDFFVGAIAEARESQKVSAITAQVIKSTGGAANISAGQVGKLATSISNMTGIDDEAVQAGANLLLTFKNVRNEAGAGNDIFNQTTKIMTDMATAMGNEPKAAAIQLGKALNDPIKGITALTRVGVTFTDQQKKQIETLVQSGRTIDAQKIILKELNSEFGGTAAAAATAGEKMSTAFANFKETIGTALLPYLDRAENAATRLLITMSNGAGPALAKFKRLVEPVTTALGAFTSQINALVHDHLQPFFTFLSGLGGATIASFSALIGSTLVSALGLLASALLSPVAIVGFLGGAAIYAYRNFAQFRTTIDGLAESFRSNVLPVLVSFAAWIQNTGVPAIRNFGDYVKTTVIPNLRALAQEVNTNLRPAFTQMAASFQSQVLPALKQFGAELRKDGPDIKVIVLALLQLTATWIRVATTITGTVLPPLIRLQSFLAGKEIPVLGRLISVVLKAAATWVTFARLVTGAEQAIISSSAKMTKSIISGFAKIITAAAAVPGKMVAALRSGVVQMVGVGKDLIQGLVNGIKAAGNLVIAGVGDIVDAAISYAKSKLHIGSPSKLFHQFGFWTMEGFANGIGDAGPKALMALQDSLGKLTDWATSWRDKIKSTLDGVKQDFASLRDSVASSFSGGLFDVSAISASVSDTTITAAQSVGQVFMNNLADTKGRLTELLKAFRKLKGWGLSSQFLSQLFASGNSALILELAGGTKKGASSAAGLFGDVQSLSNQLGTAVAGNQFNPQLKRLEDRLDKANGHLKYLDGLAHDITKALNAAAAAAHRRHAAA